MSPSDRSAVIEKARTDFSSTLEQLEGYLTIPAISCEPEHAGDVAALAGKIRDDLASVGLDNARVLELEGALPVVAAEWMKAGDAAPTVLVYGHLDLQPVVGEPWSSDPHAPTRRDGRLFARGSSDDMGGWMSHLAAVKAWLEVEGGLPCNLRLIIEGEEEIGSPNLERYMTEHADAFEADVMILTDCENPSPEVPGLTTSLRGCLEMQVTCKALTADVHSGLWGGMVPDASVSLCQVIAGLVDEQGRLKVGLADWPSERREKAAAVPFDHEVIRQGARLRDGVDPLPLGDRSAAEWLWLQPAVTVVATSLPGPEAKKNALRAEASAILSIRLAPGQEPSAVFDAIASAIQAVPHGGVEIDVVEVDWAAHGWLYEPRGPAFEAADRAYEASWGHPMARIGVGGTIPFVSMFADRYGDTPLILNGVMDPISGAHGPDESLHLGIFEKAILANVHLYAELGALGKSGLMAG
ncbi:MAG: M20/M25/M40 family metallo-hydrolase [Acidobacteriota bacterium]